MYDPEMRKDCPMRGNLGNCSPVGGFCMDAVSDEICEAVHNAYQHGYGHAIIRLKEQEAVKIEVKKINGSGRCGRCPNCLMELNEMDYPEYCGYCGQKVKWDA